MKLSLRAGTVVDFVSERTSKIGSVQHAEKSGVEFKGLLRGIPGRTPSFATPATSSLRRPSNATRALSPGSFLCSVVAVANLPDSKLVAVMPGEPLWPPGFVVPEVRNKNLLSWA